MRYVLDLAFEHVQILQRMVDKRDSIIRKGTQEYKRLDILYVGLLEKMEKLTEKNEKLVARNTKLLKENDQLLQGIIKELRRDEEIIKLKNKINELK